MGEDGRAVAFHVLVAWMPGPDLARIISSVALRPSSGSRRVVAVQLNQVEGIQEHCGIASAVADDAIEARHSVVATASPSMMQERERNLATDSTIRGKRYVRSLLGRL